MQNMRADLQKPVGSPHSRGFNPSAGQLLSQLTFQELILQNVFTITDSAKIRIISMRLDLRHFALLSCLNGLSL